jgi:hypothetical protein
MDDVFKGIGEIVFLLFVMFFAGLIFAFPTKWLINYLFTPSVLRTVLGVAQITFWRSYALTMLSGFLVKGVNTASTSTK